MNLYWVGNSGNWSDNTNHWSASSGGAPGASKPTKNDNVYFDALSFTIAAQTVTVDETALCKDFIWTGALNTPTFDLTTNLIDIYGNTTLITGMIVTSTLNTLKTQWVFTGETGTTHYHNFAGQTIKGEISFTSENYSTGIIESHILLSDLIIQTESDGVGIDYSNFDANDFDVTISAITSDAEFTVNCSDNTGIHIYNFKMGNGIWTLTGTELYFQLTVAYQGLLTFNAELSTIVFNLNKMANSYTSLTLVSTLTTDTYFNIVKINGVNLQGYNAGTNDTITIENWATAKYKYMAFHELLFFNVEGAYVEFDDVSSSSYAPSYFAFDHLILNGTDETDEGLVYIEGPTNNGGLLYKPTGRIVVNYANISYSHTSGGATWYACHSVDGGNNTGWTFSCPTFYALEGEPMGTGIYTLGRHSTSYPLILDLTYPISARDGTDLVLDGVEIGSILIDGQDVYVAWKLTVDGVETYGIDKLDYDNKLSGAYIETRVLSGNREQFGNFSKMVVSYAELPTGTNITLQYSKDYGTTWTNMTTKDDTARKLLYCEEEFEASSVAYRAVVTATGNDAPAIERADIVMR